jgi:small-conductance mechanosensitive channel/CRP-like cAMP-binding protein
MNPVGWLTLPADIEFRRQLLVAVAAVATLLVSLPTGRRRLAWLPLTFLVCAAGPLLLPLLAPDSPEAPRIAVLVSRFFLLASFLQSALLFVGVAVWERIARPMPRIFLDVLGWLMIAAAGLSILYESGINAGNLFTGSAVVTAVLGFALRDTLGNVFAGLAIHAEHPFEVGDWIQYDANPAHIGRVVEINWRATKVITLDEAYVIVPNGQLAQASIRNFTKPERWSRRSLFVVTPYSVPPQRVQAIILEAIRGSFGVLDHPAPSVVTNDFKERGVEHWVRLFTTEFDKRDRVDGMARDRIWYALTRHGIELPVATHAVRLTEIPAPPPEPEGGVVDRRIGTLRCVGLLAVLEPGQLRLVAEQGHERLYAAGDTVIREGDRGESMFVVMRGRVAVEASQPQAGLVRLAELGPGEYFGEMSLMTGTPRMATVTALEETLLLELGRDAVRGVLAANPRLVERLGEALHRRLAEREQAIANSEKAPAESTDLFRKICEIFYL